ncbi:SDR family NAD(P)-dependent oxidoreductase [Microbispora sp. NPDC046973]|uniref:SDR family NAD(P)-dependent oxidoreductase n=1 Tax=Microbispora sp. NPDC046973 TaxID=3155022 RepID=UPI0033C0BF68
MAIENRAVLVTGAAGGIGRAAVEALVARGYTVYAAVRGEDASLGRTAGVRVVTMDVTDPGSVASAAERVHDEVRGRGLHAVVNNAGIIVQGPLELVPPDDLRKQFAVNTLGPAFVTQAFLPLLRAGRGRIVNVSAPTAHVALPFMAPISASKAALKALTDALRVELAAWRIPVISVEPGATATAIFDKADAAARKALAAADPHRVALYDDHLARFGKAIAGQKTGPAEAVAATIATAVEARDPKRRYPVSADVRVYGMLAHAPAGLRERLVTRAFGLQGIRAGDSAR